MIVYEISSLDNGKFYNEFLNGFFTVYFNA